MILVPHVQSWVPLDKSEGVVKAEFTWAVREHRMRRQIGLRTKHLGITR